MKLKQNEQVIKVFHHHYTSLIIRELKVAFLSIPFFFLVYLLTPIVSTNTLYTIYFVVSFGFIAVILYDGILYWMDRLIITNMRVLYVDWKNIFIRTEHEAELIDIQDIETTENGILSFLHIFDYGDFKLETASAHTIINFNEAPDPEGIKHFIYHLVIKPNRIRNVSSHFGVDDKARQYTEESSAVTRRQ